MSKSHSSQPSGGKKETAAQRSASPDHSPLWVKILILVLIVVLIAGIWLLKNGNNDKPQAESMASGNANFALNVTESLDMVGLKSYGLPIMLEFGADWCGPCQTMKPLIEELNSELQGQVIIKYVDTDVHSDIAAQYPVTYIPTQVFFDASGNPYVPPADNPYELTMHTDKSGKHTFTTHTGVISKDSLLSLFVDMGMEEQADD